MIPYEIEAIYLGGTVIYTIRLYFQAKESAKEKRSVNPKIYWTLTILASILMIAYGLLIGSVLMAVINGLTIIYSIYHYQIEEGRKTE